MHKNNNLFQAFQSAEALNAALPKEHQADDKSKLPEIATGYPWKLMYPSLADSLWFDYPRLCTLSYESGDAFGKSNTGKTVAVVGAGIAGTTAARELTRAGYKVTLIEASNRVGGRTYSQRVLKGDEQGIAVPQLTCIEQGAMRIPFFNLSNPSKTGPGPHVGGPYHTSYTQTGPRTSSNMSPVNSMAEWKALWFGISTLAFPDPGKAGLPNYFPGVPTKVYVNDGWGVDLVQLYGAESPHWADQKNLPSKTFCYDWPADSGSVSFPPATLPNPYCPKVAFYNRGSKIDPNPIWKNGYAPEITLGHAIPDLTPPPQLASNPNDVEAWKQGVYGLRTILYKWSLFAGRFTWAISMAARQQGPDAFRLDGLPITNMVKSFNMCYDQTNWENFWFNKILPHYQNLNFFEVATAAPILPTQQAGGGWLPPAEWYEGNFGGLGMSGEEANLFYTMGAGDGSWGAFFPLSSLWALRALLFGYANQHQLILGKLNADQNDVDPNLAPTPDRTPYGVPNRTQIKDTAGNNFDAPQYCGVNSFTECNLFQPLATKTIANGDKSFYELATNGSNQCRMYVNAKCTAINRVGTENIQVGVTNPDGSASDASGTYNFIVMTVPIWNTETDMTITGFKEAGVPLAVNTALDVSHWIRSAKVFVALKSSYWTNADTNMAQVFATNTELQDWYAYNSNNGSDAGCALISYTWEDDSQKFTAYKDEKALTQMLMKKCNEVLARAGIKYNSTGAQVKIEDFMVDPTLNFAGSYSVWRWSLEPQYHGCARANQTGIENLASLLLKFNVNYAAQSQMYFAGDAYSQESGWLEPAFRLGTDAALNLIYQDSDSTKQTFGGQFDYASNYTVGMTVTSTMSERTYRLGLPYPPEGVQKAGTVGAADSGCNCTIA